MIYGPYILSFYHFIRDEQVKNYIKNNNMFTQISNKK